MPVILDEAVEAEVARSRTRRRRGLLALLRPTDELIATEVSDAVNDVREDGPHLLDAAA